MLVILVGIQGFRRAEGRTMWHQPKPKYESVGFRELIIIREDPLAQQPGG